MKNFVDIGIGEIFLMYNTPYKKRDSSTASKVIYYKTDYQLIHDSFKECEDDECFVVETFYGEIPDRGEYYTGAEPQGYYWTKGIKDSPKINTFNSLEIVFA